MPAAELRGRVSAAHGALRRAVIANDPDARARLYLPGATSMPEYQPALYGADEIAAYHRAMRDRRRVIGYDPEAAEVIDLGGTAIEFGTFTISWSLPGGAREEERGKYAHVWAVQPDRSLRLKADIWGYFRPLPDPAAFFVAMPQAGAPPTGPTSADPGLAQALQAGNDRIAAAVRSHDAEARLTIYADDAAIMPHADTNRTGIDEIRPYILAYTEGGRGATFDSVSVWNAGFEDLGSHVIEYPKFRVEWRSGEASGVVTGGGLRLWRRRGDGSLELLREIGTHDHR